MDSRRLIGRLCKRANSVTKSSADDDGPCNTSSSRISDNAGHCSRRRGYDDQFGDEWQIGDSWDRRHPANFRVVRVNDAEFATESRSAKVFEDR